MRLRQLAAFLLPTAMVLTSCREGPTVPSEGEPPSTAIVSDPSEGSIPLLPLPGETDVAISGESGGLYVGASGGKAALWTWDSDGAAVPTELAQLDVATDVAFYGNVVQFVGSADGRAAVVREDTWQQYPVLDLGTLPGDDRSTASAIELGFETILVAGDSWATGREDESRAFLWDGTTMVALPPLPGHVRSRALSVTAVQGGTVAGLSYPTGGSPEIVVWSDGVPAPTGYDHDAYFAHGIQNDRGAAALLISARAGNEVVGWRDGATNTLEHPHGDDPSRNFEVAGASNHPTIMYKVEVDEPLTSYRFGQPVERGDFQALGALPLDRCMIQLVCTSPMRQYPMIVTDAARPEAAVKDLTVTSNGETSIALAWTEVDDGTGSPAHYRVRYAQPRLGTRIGTLWSDAATGCDVEGVEIGAPTSCTVSGLDPDTPYDFALMSYRVEDGAWADATYSNLAVGQTGWNGGGEPDPDPDPQPEPEPAPMIVGDLTVWDVGPSSAALRWTQVDDGTGSPAWYRLKYSTPSIDWKTATVACERQIEGDEIGREIGCTIGALAPSMTYDFQLMSYRMVDGVWHDAQYSNIATAQTSAEGGTPGPAPTSVHDLVVSSVAGSEVTLEWTQVDDGTGNPAWYRVKYSPPGIDWGSATIGCDRQIEGEEIGAKIACTVEGLVAGTPYDFQLMSYRMVDGVWEDARYSNIASSPATGGS